MMRAAVLAALPPAALPAAAQTQTGAPGLTFTSYGWLSATDGRMGAGGRSVGVSNSFRDTIQDSDTVLSFMARGEYRQNRLGLFLDGMYSRLGYDDLPLGAAVANATSALFILEAGAAWEAISGRLGTDGDWALDMLGGACWTRVRNQFEVNGIGTVADRRTDWVDPFIGLRLRGQFSPHWEYTLRGDVGGFGIGSDFAWQAAATIGYRFELLGLQAVAHAGYRALSQDYQSRSLVWDITLHGPLVGLSLRF